MSRIHAVDALRGLAASVVAFHHAFVIFPEPFHRLREYSQALYRIAQFISDCNGEAVILFFVISGFSIRLSANRLDFTRKEDVNLYLYKRFKRLLPLYWYALALTIALALAAGTLQGDAFSLANLIGNLLFLQSPPSTRGNWFVPYGGNSPLWSLSFEMFFYLLFPLITIIQRRFECKSTLKTLVLVSAISFGSLAFYNLAPNPVALFASHFLIWYLGVEIAEVHLRHKPARDGLVPWAVLWGLVWVVVARTGSATLINVLIGLTIFVLWRAAQIFPIGKSRVAQAGVTLFYKAFGGLGLISYAIYLLHYPILKYVATVGADGRGLALGGAAIACIAMAWLAESLAKRSAYNFLKRRYWL